MSAPRRFLVALAGTEDAALPERVAKVVGAGGPDLEMTLLHVRGSGPSGTRHPRPCRSPRTLAPAQEGSDRPSSRGRGRRNSDPAPGGLAGALLGGPARGADRTTRRAGSPGAGDRRRCRPAERGRGHPGRSPANRPDRARAQERGSRGTVRGRPLPRAGSAHPPLDVAHPTQNGTARRAFIPRAQTMPSGRSMAASERNWRSTRTRMT